RATHPRTRPTRPVRSPPRRAPGDGGRRGRGGLRRRRLLDPLPRGRGAGGVDPVRRGRDVVPRGRSPLPRRGRRAPARPAAEPGRTPLTCYLTVTRGSAKLPDRAIDRSVRWWDHAAGSERGRRDAQVRPGRGPAAGRRVRRRYRGGRGRRGPTAPAGGRARRGAPVPARP